MSDFACCASIESGSVWHWFHKHDFSSTVRISARVLAKIAYRFLDFLSRRPSRQAIQQRPAHLTLLPVGADALPS